MIGFPEAMVHLATRSNLGGYKLIWPSICTVPQAATSRSIEQGGMRGRLIHISSRPLPVLAPHAILTHTVFKYAGSAALMGKSGGCGP